MAVTGVVTLLCITLLLLAVGASADPTNGNSTRGSISEILADPEKGINPRNRVYWWLFGALKWCGPGNSADDYNDLGSYVKTDSCCRDHDHCDHYIPAGETKYGLHNPTDYTRSHCACDYAFKHCLLEAAESMSDTIGRIFFNSVEMVCFKEEYPIKKCKKKRGEFCQIYTVDKSQPKEWQYFAPAPYKRCPAGKKGKKCRKQYYKQ